MRVCDDDVVAASLEARQRMRARAHLHCIGVSVTSPTHAAGQCRGFFILPCAA